ncbi:hypothetical protein [Deinococcus altitudinis]|uniref:hypothetical protein n=1 Tax=Deinococcus altitudinis TaxID=468914 RepID=UPI0038911C8B
MNDRIYQALTTAGLNTSPLSILDHASAYASAFFALYDNELVYHEGGKNSQVPLRDVTRIHSDREGVLRVETSERTAVTASLLGYDPGRVQAFFQQVRDVTARAKELPVLPLNISALNPARTEPVGAPPAATPASSLPNTGMPGLSAYTPAATAPAQFSPAAPTPAPFTPAPPVPAPSTPATTSVFIPAAQPAAGLAPAVSQNDPESAATIIAAPLPGVPGAATGSSAAGTVPYSNRQGAPRPEPVVISSMPPVSDPPAFQERAGERNRQASKAATRTADTLTQMPASPAAVSPVISSPISLPSGAHTQGPLVSVPSSAGYELSPDAQGASDELLRRADGVQGLARTVGLLAIVLGLAAVALAYFQWQNTGNTTGGTLSAIWTLLAGGVGAVALLAFAEALRLLSALARTTQAAADRSVQNQP